MPDTCEVLLFGEGSWLFLDGGTLDLGIVRDATLTSTNDALVFAESFEEVALVNGESVALSMDLCPDGTSRGTSVIDPCSTGS